MASVLGVSTPEGSLLIPHTFRVGPDSQEPHKVEELRWQETFWKPNELMKGMLI